MKIKLRFVSFFTVGLVSFIIYMGVIMVFLFNFLLPTLNISEANEFIAFILVLLLTLISGGTLFSVYFINPLLLMLLIINQLSKGNYDISKLNNKLYTDNGHLKKRYFLYKELVNDLSILSRKLEKTKREREHLQQAKEEWIRGISHDLKTPLSYILGYSALLAKKDYEWKEEELRKFLNEIYIKGKYMEQLVSGLKLSLTKEHSSTIMPISIATFNVIPFLQELIAEIANQSNSSDYELSFEHDIDSVEIQADQQLLYRAFQNLLNNAIKHNPPQTKISIYVKTENKNAISVEFADNGIGLENQYKEMLMKADPALNSGRGLAVVKNIILAHKGSIVVYSTKGSYTQIIVQLPIKI